jgi:uncharacterized RDD family membrane protein YckC
MRIDNIVEITIPEGVSFTIPLAGPVVRSLAAIVDVIIAGALNAFAMKMISILTIFSSDFFGFAVIISQLVLGTGYAIVTEWLMNGQTFGKKFFHLRVIDSSGLPLKLYQVILRNLMRPVDQLPLFYLTGGVACFFSRHFQRLGDQIANTVVVVARKGNLEQIPEFPSSRYNSLLQVPHLCARIRQAISPELRAIATDALFRAKEFDSKARIELFRKLSELFKSKCSLPAEYTDGIPDENLVTNIVEVLFYNRNLKKNTAISR